MRQAARLANGLHEQLFDLPRHSLQRLVILDLVVQHAHLEFRRRQHLLQVVVQNLRQPFSLAVLGPRQFHRQVLKLAGALLQFLVCLLPLGHVFQVQYEELHLAGVIQQGRQPPVPVAQAVLVSGIRESLGIGSIGLLRLHDLLEDDPVLLARIEIEMVLADEVLVGLVVGPGIGLVDSHEIEIAVHERQGRDRVLKEAFEHLPAFTKLAFRLHAPGHFLAQLIYHRRQSLRARAYHPRGQTPAPNRTARPPEPHVERHSGLRGEPPPQRKRYPARRRLDRSLWGRRRCCRPPRSR